VVDVSTVAAAQVVGSIAVAALAGEGPAAVATAAGGAAIIVAEAAGAVHSATISREVIDLMGAATTVRAAVVSTDVAVTRQGGTPISSVTTGLVLGATIVRRMGVAVIVLGRVVLIGRGAMIAARTVMIVRAPVVTMAVGVMIVLRLGAMIAREVVVLRGVVIVLGRVVLIGRGAMIAGRIVIIVRVLAVMIVHGAMTVARIVMTVRAPAVTMGAGTARLGAIRISGVMIVRARPVMTADRIVPRVIVRPTDATIVRAGAGTSVAQIVMTVAAADSTGVSTVTIVLPTGQIAARVVAGTSVAQIVMTVAAVGLTGVLIAMIVHVVMALTAVQTAMIVRAQAGMIGVHPGNLTSARSTKARRTPSLRTTMSASCPPACGPSSKAFPLRLRTLSGATCAWSACCWTKTRRGRWPMPRRPNGGRGACRWCAKPWPRRPMRPTSIALRWPSTRPCDA